MPVDREAATRRRGASLEEALLEAAWQEVSAVGYADVTIEGVAARAHTSKTVLYRRWRNRAELVMAALRSQGLARARELPDTGSLREDVLGVLRGMRSHLRAIRPDVVNGLRAELREVPPQVLEIVPKVMMSILERAAARGEIRLERVSPRLASLPGDLLRHELLLVRGSGSDAFLAELVDDLFLPLLARNRPSRG